MTKKIPCYECGGKGWYSRVTDTKSWSETCEHCNGLGVVEVPYTNFDYIHRMNQEEFVKWLANLDSICECCSYCVDEYCAGEASYCEKGVNEFLSKEYKEDSNV